MAQVAYYYCTSDSGALKVLFKKFLILSLKNEINRPVLKHGPRSATLMQVEEIFKLNCEVNALGMKLKGKPHMAIPTDLNVYQKGSS